jgi:hypothetical protein
MEQEMNKSMMIMASAVVAAATSFAPMAYARGGGGHHSGGGGGMKMSSGPKSSFHHHHLRVFRRDAVVSSSYKTEEPRTKRIKSVIVPADKGPILKYADGKGRAYDLASKTWCDGNRHCWTGALAWTFKDGAWFYGTSRWYEAGGTWKTDAAAAAPVAVDCETIPAFASLKPTTGQQVARKDFGNDGLQKGGSSAAPKPAECKKYFPSLGEMVSVPCEG